MPPTYTVRAQVVDIRTDMPRASDRFLVDTNVWAWEHYPTSTLSPTGMPLPQVTEYSPYLARMRTAGTVRCRLGLSLAELAHLVEQKELEIYSAAVAPLTTKEYRHNLPTERARVEREVQRAWDRIKADSSPLTLTIDDPTTDAALSRFAAEPVDGYDLFLLVAMAAAGVTQLLSDDGDFCAVADIDVFTANPRVLAAARTQGQLVVR